MNIEENKGSKSIVKVKRVNKLGFWANSRAATTRPNPAHHVGPAHEPAGPPSTWANPKNSLNQP